jgi:hypothetical protein
MDLDCKGSWIVKQTAQLGEHDLHRCTACAHPMIGNCGLQAIQKASVVQCWRYVMTHLCAG